MGLIVDLVLGKFDADQHFSKAGLFVFRIKLVDRVVFSMNHIEILKLRHNNFGLAFILFRLACYDHVVSLIRLLKNF